MNDDISKSLIIENVRISRPTNQLELQLSFYCDGLGLPLFLRFPEDASGYAGAVLGIPGQSFHLEFCTHRKGFNNCAPPTQDNLIVFYLKTPADLKAIVTHMRGLGFSTSPATNLHWGADGVTFEDPDGWRVVLMLRNNVNQSI